MTDLRERLASIIGAHANQAPRYETADAILAAFPQMNPQTYSYIGKDGKQVLARELEDERDQLREENAALREALEEYAKKENWRRVGLMPQLPCWAVHDAGETARKALGKLKES